jgi:hypothetical protein
VWNKLRRGCTDTIKKQVSQTETEQRTGCINGQPGHIPGFDADLDDDVPF